MRAVIQRVSKSSVTVDGEVIGKIDQGLMVLLGVAEDDEESDAHAMAKKIAHLRIFSDDEGLFNLSAIDVGGSVLLVSQFTLLGDCRKGRRPSFIKAARPEQAIPLYEMVIQVLRGHDLQVETGSFGAKMNVSLVNDGPVTLIVDTKKEF